MLRRIWALPVPAGWETAAGKPTGRRKERDGEAYEKSREIRRFPIVPYPEETELAPSRATELAREGQDEANGFNGGRWVYNGWCPGCEKGNRG